MSSLGKMYILRKSNLFFETFRPCSTYIKYAPDPRRNETINPKESKLIKFDDAAFAFGHKSTRELLRAYLVLNVCAVDLFVQKSQDLMKLGEKILSPKLLTAVVSPFYNQFIAGNSEAEFKKITEYMASFGINTMLAPTLETDVGDSTCRNDLFEANYRKTMDLILLSSKCRLQSRENNCMPTCQTKITAHISAESLFCIASKYETLSIREKEESIQEMASALEKSSKEPISELSFKHMRFEDKDIMQLKNALPRLYKIGQLCKERNVILTIDAEYSYVNSAINFISLALMLLFNKNVPIIWNTYQAYLKNSRYWIDHDYNIMKTLGSSFGIKVVRGAYMEKEKIYANRNKISSAVQDSYEDTNKNYDNILNYAISNIVDSTYRCQMMVATHNEASIIHTLNLMKKFNMNPNTTNIIFAQIYGMADYISFPLTNHGYNVYKSVPYGSISETIPYLSRRANENRAVMKGSRQERILLAQELKKRLNFIN